jgi:pimeloyl-ACP methyl ester carboxylesterase
MPFDLAVTGINRADAIIAHVGTGVPVVIGGHSLGGAMASDYASRHAAQLKGMVLFGAYPAGNVTVSATRGPPCPCGPATTAWPRRPTWRVACPGFPPARSW